ncbi:MAG: ABC transporter permease [Gammaproteobacteria bacterium]|nr:ABC transporter permease [Gammaproteobacteria bacterium]
MKSTVVVCAGFIIGLAAAAAAVGALAPLDITTIDLQRILYAPGHDALLGYDELGRAVLPRLLVALATSLQVAIVVVGCSALLGTLIGIVSGWYGGATDYLLMRIVDVCMAFPGLLLAIVLAGLLGAGLGNVVIALVTVGWLGFTRLARAQTLSVRQRDHVQAARVLGTPVTAILWRHVLPLVLTPLWVEASLAVAGVVIAEASLSFLGLGIQAPAPSLGSMIRDGTRYMLVAPHLVLAPGITLFVLVLAINLLGDAWRDRLGKPRA